MPTRLAAPRLPSSAAGLPSTVISPCAGVSSPSIWRNNTVLPVPEPPTSDMTSPRSTVKSRSLWMTAFLSPVSKTVHSLRISTTVSVMSKARGAGPPQASAAASGGRELHAVNERGGSTFSYADAFKEHGEQCIDKDDDGNGSHHRGGR